VKGVRGEEKGKKREMRDTNENKRESKTGERWSPALKTMIF